jgi:hypothetical protein
MIVVRTPPPEAPTASSSGTALPRQVDPHVEICASAAQIRVGQTVTVIGQSVDIGLPYFTLSARDEGSGDRTQIAQVTYDNQVSGLQGGSQVLEFVAAEGSLSQVVVTLRAAAAGTTELVIGATGEIHYGYPGPATWAGGGSEPITIVVSP